MNSSNSLADTSEIAARVINTPASRPGGRPSSTYVYPDFILIDLWAKAVERAGILDGAAVTAELEKMTNEPTTFEPRSFSNEIHHQNTAEMQIIEITDGTPGSDIESTYLNKYATRPMIVDQMPVTSAQKVDRIALRTMLESGSS